MTLPSGTLKHSDRTRIYRRNLLIRKFFSRSSYSTSYFADLVRFTIDEFISFSATDASGVTLHNPLP